MTHAYHARTEQYRLLDAWTGADLDQWLARTTWWTRRDAVRTREGMTVELLEAVAGRFLGRRLDVEVGGTSISLHLDQVRVETDAPTSSDLFSWWSELPGSREVRRFTRAVTGQPPETEASGGVDRVLIDASEVTIDGHAVGDVTATVRDVRIAYGTTTEVVTGSIDLHVLSTRQHVVDWLTRVLPDWQIALADLGRVAARPPGRRIVGLVEPEGLDGTDAVVHVVGFRAFGRDFRLPRRLVRRIVQPLPVLPQNLELGTARVGDPDIEVALEHPGLRLPVRPEHVRAAVREGVSLLRLG